MSDGAHIIYIFIHNFYIVTQKGILNRCHSCSSTPLLFLLLLYLLPLYLVVVYYANFVFFVLFKGSSKCGFPPCCPVKVLSFARCCVSFMLCSEQIKWWWWSHNELNTTSSLTEQLYWDRQRVRNKLDSYRSRAVIWCLPCCMCVMDESMLALDNGTDNGTKWKHKSLRCAQTMTQSIARPVCDSWASRM